MQHTGVTVGTGERNKLGRSGCERSSTSNLNLGTLGIDLLGRSSASGTWWAKNQSYSGQGVKSDRFEPDEVITRRDCGGDGRRPGRILGDHLTVSPESVEYRTGEQSSFVDLELKHVKLL